MRISRHQAFMLTASAFAMRSTCFRLNVGCVITCDKNIVAIGYNGPPPGAPHCTGKHCTLPGQGCQRALHAEANAIARIPLGDYPQGFTAYVTDSPCHDCFYALVRRGVKSLYFSTPYRITHHMDKAHINIYRLLPSGYVIDWRTGELVDDQ